METPEVVYSGHYKLGANRSPHDNRTLKLSDYTAALPDPPPMVNWLNRVKEFPMLGNSDWGDCVEAYAGHQIQIWTGGTFMPTDAEILGAYTAITGFNPNDPSTDQGTAIIDLLKYWRTTGIAGHKIGGFLQVNPASDRQCKLSIDLFGGVCFGVDLPITAQTTTKGNNGLPVWGTPTSLSGDAQPGSWGGHCICGGRFSTNPNGQVPMEIVTWGMIYDMAAGFRKSYCSEGWAVFSTDWLTAGKAPNGFNGTQLLADLARVTA